MSSLKIRISLCLLAGFFACRQPTTRQVRVEERQTASGHRYSIFHPQKLAVRVVTSRPPAADSAYQLSVAAAYTNLENDQPLDLLVDQGRVRQTKPIIPFLDGVLQSVGDTLTIGRLPAGPAQLGAQLAGVRRRHGTLLLQELLVLNGKPQRFGPGNAFQRRALVEFAAHRFAVAESAADNLTMSQFAEDLRELGAQNALYLDMGDWDEGWYKAGNEVVKLGARRTQTARQSNWLVFATPVAALPGPSPAP
ncbi:hypothetical protein [Hymenobacter cheonanensis]|uniref:hypothetical protein n=1 Tax=Hymenobacter sp. CA2-7 TaxID=3063993 RepID=UPI00271254C3|nr:hypothetical protein [Hymenobacter sp. CA2-7]MDO7887936.1 hypothetical protein [Hymenobacter sp. CA2-7]